MPEPPDSDAADLAKAIAQKVREASRSGRPLPLKDVWQGTEDEFRAWKQSQPPAGMEDIALFREQGKTYCHSELHMTRSYAQAAARARCQDICWAIVETVRSDSRTYPRPTPLAAFSEPPFMFPRDSIEPAVREISGNPDYQDIGQVRSSDGSVFLFSSTHLDRGHAESLAEWLAVGRLQNP